MPLYSYNPRLSPEAKSLITHLEAGGATVDFKRQHPGFRVEIAFLCTDCKNHGEPYRHAAAIEHRVLEDALWLAYAEYGMNFGAW